MSVVHKSLDEFEFGKAILMEDGNEASIFAVGDMLKKALEARQILLGKGIKVRVYDMHTVKPIDKIAIIQAAQETGAIVAVEDNNILGGLGGAISEIVCENWPVSLIRVGINDSFGESGNYEKLLEKYHMTSEDIVKAVMKSVKMKNGV